jgi:hypothetical protein
LAKSNEKNGRDIRVSVGELGTKLVKRDCGAELAEGFHVKYKVPLACHLTCRGGLPQDNWRLEVLSMKAERRAARVTPATAGITRGEVAKRLGVSVASVRRMEGEALHPVRREGVWTFDPREVEQIAPGRRSETRGEVAAAIFEMLDRGASFSEIVRLTRQSPEAVRDLHQQWRTGFNCLDDEPDDSERLRDEAELREWEQQMLAMQREQAQEDDER